MASCFLSAFNAQSIDSIDLAADFLTHHKQTELSLKGLLREVRLNNRVGLISRINCCFPKDTRLTAKEALHCAELLNHLLVHSKVFVVQDIDGDQRYSFRMDTLLQGSCDRENIARFLDDITVDVEVLLHFFQGHPLAPDEPSKFSAKALVKPRLTAA